MNIVLTETTCKVCGSKLSQYEVEEKDRHCMNCYEEPKK